MPERPSFFMKKIKSQKGAFDVMKLNAHLVVPYNVMGLFFQAANLDLHSL